jgi:hypothetical protein
MLLMLENVSQAPTLRSRDFAREQRDAAAANGNRRDARKWDSELRKWEKLIAQYGMDR